MVRLEVIELKINIKLEESTQLLELSIAAISNNCTQVTDDFVGVGCFMNNYTTKLAQLPPTLII